MRKYLPHLIIVVLLALLFFMPRCRKDSNDERTTESTTVTKVTERPAEPTAPAIPDPVVLDTNELKEKGVDYADLLQRFNHVASRYEHYKQKSIEQENELMFLAALLNEADDCEGRDSIYQEKIAVLDQERRDAGQLIDHLYDQIEAVSVARSYEFEEKDEYSQRTVSIHTIGYLPEGGYQVSNKRYFIPETTTEKTEYVRSLPLNQFGLGYGARVGSGEVSKLFGASYHRRLLKKYYIGPAGSYSPGAGEQGAELNIMGQLLLNF